MALIVYIEDEAELRAEVAAELRDNGFDVVEAGDGASGLTLIRRLKPDLVLCDIALPGINGGEVLQRLRRDNPELALMPFVFLTALAGRDQVIRGKDQGADDYLTKPIDLGVLVATVNARLGQIARIEGQVAVERTELLDRMTRESELSFLSAADVLNHLAVGVALLTADGSIVYLNQAARKLVEDDDGLQVSATGLRCATARETDSLRAAVRNAAAGMAGDDTVQSLTRPSLRRPYQVMVSALQPADGGDATARRPVVALFIHDPDAVQTVSQEALIRLYGLTAGEARVVAALAAGQSMDDIGTTLQVSRNTIATHLKRAFDKTGTASQRDLVALVLSAAAVTRGPADHNA